MGDNTGAIPSLNKFGEDQPTESNNESSTGLVQAQPVVADDDESDNDENESLMSPQNSDTLIQEPQQQFQQQLQQLQEQIKQLITQQIQQQVQQQLRQVQTNDDTERRERSRYIDRQNNRYKTGYKKLGRFVIFNQETFKTQSKREGTNVDAENLEHTFKTLGFEILGNFHNYTRSQILNEIKKLSDMDHSDYYCFGCAILTHGDKDGVLHAHDDEMHIDDFTTLFQADRCKTLAGKPKLFFIQACRGNNCDSGQTVDTTDNTEEVNNDDEVDGGRKIIIPVEADFLVAHSTPSDYYAWRNTTYGSWFIQALCKVFSENGKELEIMQLMTRMNAMVTDKFESDQEKYKQIPSVMTQLRAEVYFSDH